MVDPRNGYACSSVVRRFKDRRCGILQRVHVHLIGQTEGLGFEDVEIGGLAAFEQKGKEPRGFR
jgi:hypothetical protein